METVTDEQMRARLAGARPYTVVILKTGPRRNDDDAQQIIWEHARRNFALRADGRLAIVLPVSDGSDVAGVGAFALDLDQTHEVMDRDPAVEAGVLVYEAHASRGFPGDSLPG